MSSILGIDFNHRDFIPLLDHWLARRGDRVVPLRRDIDPLAFKKLLPDCWIYRLRDNGEFHCTLAGDEIRQSWNQTLMGRPAHHVIGAEDYRYIARRWLMVIERPALLYSTQRKMNIPKRSERLVLPVADDDGTVRQILGASRYDANRDDDELSPSFRSDDVRVWEAATLERVPDSEIPH